MNILKRIDQMIDSIVSWFVVGVLGLMIVMAFAQVVLRNIFHSNIEWGDIFLRHLVLWVGFFGAIIATGERRHLKIEFVSKLVPKKIHKAFLILTNIFAAIICYFLMQAAIAFVQSEIETGEILILNLPTWYFILVIPIGYAVIAFRFLVHSVVWIWEIFRGHWEVAEVQHL
ncbi:MAG TPA: TRAP transporter small permease [Bacteroidota bacterium]|nr:TRAP transporter small permease [Bacteroidota bacterium]